MTFYNIIFGILFLCAVREVLQAFVDRCWPKFWMSTALGVLICNDILYTSHCIEENHIPYTISMKLADLTNFLLLAACVMVLSPTGNLLGVQSTRSEVAGHPPPRRALGEPAFWFLLSAYWGLCMFWNVVGGAYAAENVAWRRTLPLALSIPLVSMWGLAWCWPRSRIMPLVRPAVAVLATLYVLLFKAPEIARMHDRALEAAAASRQTAPAVPNAAETAERRTKPADSQRR